MEALRRNSTAGLSLDIGIIISIEIRTDRSRKFCLWNVQMRIA